MKVYIKVKAKAKENKVTPQGQNSFAVRVKAEAKDGKANLALQAVLANYFKVPKSRVVLLKGRRARHKVYEVDK